MIDKLEHPCTCRRTFDACDAHPWVLRIYELGKLRVMMNFATREAAETEGNLQRAPARLGRIYTVHHEPLTADVEA